MRHLNRQMFYKYLTLSRCQRCTLRGLRYLSVRKVVEFRYKECRLYHCEIWNGDRRTEQWTKDLVSNIIEYMDQQPRSSVSLFRMWSWSQPKQIEITLQNARCFQSRLMTYYSFIMNYILWSFNILLIDWLIINHLEISYHTTSSRSTTSLPTYETLFLWSIYTQKRKKEKKYEYIFIHWNKVKTPVATSHWKMSFSLAVSQQKPTVKENCEVSRVEPALPHLCPCLYLSALGW